MYSQFYYVNLELYFAGGVCGSSLYLRLFSIHSMRYHQQLKAKHVQ